MHNLNKNNAQSSCVLKTFSNWKQNTVQGVLEYWFYIWYYQKVKKKIRIVSRQWNDNLCFQCRRLEFEVENCTVKQIYDLTGCVTNIS